MSLSKYGNVLQPSRLITSKAMFLDVKSRNFDPFERNRPGLESAPSKLGPYRTLGVAEVKHGTTDVVLLIPWQGAVPDESAIDLSRVERP